jgi:hypothetical protein
VAGVVVAVLLVGGGVVLATRGDSKNTSVSAGGAPAGAGAAGADFAGRYNVTFTVTKTKTGAEFVTIAPADGTVTSGQILLVTCNADGCSLEFDASSPPRPEGQAFGFPHPVRGDANHLTGQLLSEPQGGQCQTLNAVILSADITLQRDAAGAITGFTGTNDITHRDALFQDNGNGNTCATYDVTYSLVGTKVP